MKKALFIAFALGIFNSALFAVPLGLIPEENIIDYGADLSVYSTIYDVDPSSVVTQRDLRDLVANATGLEAGRFQRFVCMPNAVSWGGGDEFPYEGPGIDRGWQNTVFNLIPNEYVIPDLNQLLDENVLDALNSGTMQIVYQYMDW